MKKILLTCILIVVSSLNAQKKFDNYYSKYFDKSFDISISKENRNQITFYVDAFSMDSSSKQCELMIEEKKLPEFIEMLQYLKDIYLKWSETATQNKVDELQKEIDYKKIRFESAFLYGDWQFDFGMNITPVFKIIDGKYVIILRSSKLQSSSNEFITSKGFSMVFSDAKEFDDMIAKLDIDRAHDFISKEEDKKDLFKN